MTPRPSSTPTLVEAMSILAIEIESPDGVANAAIREAAARLQAMHFAIAETLRQNANLADGDNCTLNLLKTAYLP